MNATEIQKASRVNELLRNIYGIRPIIGWLDFFDYVIGDSVAVITRKELNMVKVSKLMHYNVYTMLQIDIDK